MPDAIVFDLFDTLVDLEREGLPSADWGDGEKQSTLPALYGVVGEATGLSFIEFARSLIESDIRFKFARWDQGIEITTEQRFAAFLASIERDDEDLVRRLTEVHMGWISKLSSMPDHHLDVLERLKASHRLAICSNFSHTPTAMEILEREGLLELFDVVVISADVGLRKPRREIFEEVLRGLGVSPEQVIHVGDQLAKDVQGGAGVGMRTAWLTRRVEDPAAAMAAYDGPPPDRVIADIAELV